MTDGQPTGTSYEENESIIDEELKKRRSKWYLKNIQHMDFDDVSQIIRAHIHKKWHLWDQSRPLKPWLNSVIGNNIKNLIRNNYGSFSKPCDKCPFNEGGKDSNLCSYTSSGEQSEECPVFDKWAKSKQEAFNVRVPASYDANEFEFGCSFESHIDMENAEKRLHEQMEKRLSKKHFALYRMLYIEGMKEEEAAVKIGFKTTEKGRSPGYAQIKNLKKVFQELARKIVKEEEVFFDV
jgi:DNA-directed RNA polymerase specialized sigma24 family protein